MPKENKKELIIREALKLFSEKGFAAVSMRDLAESVGISVSTICLILIVTLLYGRLLNLTQPVKSPDFSIFAVTT